MGKKSDTVDQSVLVFKELEHPDGDLPRTISFTDVEVQPLGYQQLAQAKLHEKLTIPLAWRDSMILEMRGAELDKSKRYSVSTTLESPFTSQAIGLVRGGWLPSSLAATHERATILVDRNVISQIIGRFDSGRKVAGEPDILDLFEDIPVRINPLLFVIEGNARSEPTLELVQDQLREVEVKLRAALPNATLVIGPQSLRGAYGLIEDTRNSMHNKQQFLMKVMPTLSAPVARSKIDARWCEVLAAADECDVRRSTLVVLAALSTIAVPNGRSPAKRLLKPHANYSAEDAYNALADLRSLDILVKLFGLFPDDPVQLCTADRNLALFWTGLQASNFARSGDAVSFDMTPVEQLFPGSTGARWQIDVSGG